MSCNICEGTGKIEISFRQRNDEYDNEEDVPALIPCSCKNDEHFINKIADKINEILEFRGIDDNGKNFYEDVEKYIFPIIKIYIKNL